MLYHQFETTKLLIIINLLALGYAKNEQYIGWKSYYVGATTKEQVKNLNNLRTKLELDFLSPAHVEREAVVLVQPEQHEEFIKNLNEMGINYRIHASDVKTALDHDDEIYQEWNHTIARQGDSTMPYSNYQRLNVIYSYMDRIAKKYRNITTIVDAGPSFKGRAIKYLKISSTKFQGRKPIIFIDGAIHAREWITPPVITWAIKKLTEDLTEPDLLDKYDWILFPVVNPDGYEYSFTDDRLWRKTRSSNKHIKNGICPGVDGNRNFDIEWGTVDTSKEPCDENYGGSRYFSEVETSVVRDILLKYRPRIVLYITMHSYGSYILYPWAHKLSASKNQLHHPVAVAMADAIFSLAQPHFPRYIVGSVGSILYKCSGTSPDYAHQLGIPFVYTYELPGLSDGFLLSPSHIEQVCRETWAGIAAGARKAKWLL